MASFEDTVQGLLEKYNDSIFPNRWSVLNHLYFTLGTGYIWYGGELVLREDLYDEETKRQLKEEREFQDREMEKMRKRWADQTEEFIRKFYPEEEWEEQKEKDRKRSKRIHEEEQEKMKRAIYDPLSFDGNLDIPRDIKPDWLEGLKEALSYLIDNAGDLDFYNEKDKRTSLKIAKELLEKVSS